MDPYYDTTFFEWCLALYRRCLDGYGGTLFSDEVQLCALMLFGVSSSLLGVLLVLSKNTLLANSLSHTMLLGMVLSFITQHYCLSVVPIPPLFSIYVFAIVVGLGTCSLIDYLANLRYLSSDSSNAMVFSFFFALGVALISVYSKNAHIGSELLMGDPEALDSGDLFSIFVSCVITVASVIVLLRPCTVAIFDPSFATVLNFKPHRFKRIVLFLVSLTSIVAFRAVGFVMTMAFFVLPSLIARLFARSIRGMLGLAALFSVVAAFLSVGLSRHIYTVYALPVSTGAFSVVLLALAYCCAYGGLRIKALRAYALGWVATWV